MFSLSDFHFIRPEWFWAAIPLFIILIANAYLRQKHSGWNSLIAGHLAKHLLVSRGTAKKSFFLRWVALIWSLCVVALAGPSWQKLPQPVYELETGKVIVMDLSLSMRATDVQPDRLTMARYKAIDLVHRLTEGETGLVAYAGDAFVISPLTSDGENLTTLIPSLEPEIMPALGSAPIVGIEKAVELLTNAGYQEGEIYWFTDGIEVSDARELNAMLPDLPYKISALMVGTENGAPIKLKNGQFLRDSRDQVIIPRAQITLLEQFIQRSGGKFAYLQADNSDLDYLLADSDRRNQVADTESEEEQGDVWREEGPWLLLPILLLAAMFFRRGLILVGVIGVFHLLHPQPAYANWFSDIWKNNDQQGLTSYHAGQFDQAAERFDDPMWQGAAWYRSQQYELALQAFQQVDSVDSWYNQGNTLAQLGQLDKAIEKYNQVLEQQPAHKEAAFNKALLETLQEQQENQPSSQSDSGDPQQNGEQQQGEQQDGSGQQNNEQSAQSQSGSESDEQQQSEQQQNSDSAENEEGSNQQQEDAQMAQSDEASTEQQERMMQQAEANQEMTAEELEKQMQMQNLLNKVPDDPSYLLKRKMLLEYQQRRRQTSAPPSTKNW